MFAYLDESGDLGFDPNKPGSSLYFTITILICLDKKTVDKIRQAVKRTLKNKLCHKKASRINKELKGTNTTLQIKKYFFNQLPEKGWGIYSVTLNKQRCYTHLKTTKGKKKLYNFLARFILEKCPINKTKGNVNFTVDKCKNEAEIKDFNSYIENHLAALLPLETSLNITHESSLENLLLQAADLFCWGIARKYNSNDLTWYEYFCKKVEFDGLYLK